MEYDFLAIEEHNTLVECQITALSEVNNHLIEMESCFQQILKNKNIKIENTTRTKMFSLLDYLNKIIITPTSSRNFSYQYFYYYRNIIIKMNEISLRFEYPILTNETIPSLNSLFNRILKMIKQTNQKISKKKMKKALHNKQTQNQENEQPKDKTLKNIFTKLILLKDNPFELAQAQNTFHELPNIIKTKFQEINKDPSLFLIDYSIILQSIDSAIEDINLITQSTRIFQETINLIQNLKGLEEVKCDENNEAENPNDNISNIHEDQNNDEIETSEILFKKHPPIKDAVSLVNDIQNEDQNKDDDTNNSNPNTLPALRSDQHTPERAKSLHTNLVSIIEDNDKKIQQLQQNLSNEVQKTEEAQAESTKLRHHYRKKIKKLKEQILELEQNDEQNSQQKQELEDLKLKYAKLEEENSQLEEEKTKLEEVNSKLEEENSKFKKENSKLEKENTKLEEENAKLEEEKEKLEEENIHLGKENSKLEDENINLNDKNHTLNDQVLELTDLNNTFAQEIEENARYRNEESSKAESQFNSEEIERLNETISLQELEIQELDKSKKKYIETINSLVKDNDKFREENEELKSVQSQFEKKEQILGKQISLLAAQNSKSTNEFCKALKNQEKRMNKLNEMINSQIITNPDESIKEQINELFQMKKMMAERNIDSFDELLEDYDNLKKQENH